MASPEQNWTGRCKGERREEQVNQLVSHGESSWESGEGASRRHGSQVPCTPAPAGRLEKGESETTGVARKGGLWRKSKLFI